MNDMVWWMLFWLGLGFYQFWRAGRIARRNADHIAGGEERFFEERRSWATYGFPMTEPDRIRRQGLWMIAGSVAAMLAFGVVRYLHS